MRFDSMPIFSSTVVLKSRLRVTVPLLVGILFPGLQFVGLQVIGFLSDSPCRVVPILINPVLCAIAHSNRNTTYGCMNVCVYNWLFLYYHTRVLSNICQVTHIAGCFMAVLYLEFSPTRS